MPAVVPESDIITLAGDGLSVRLQPAQAEMESWGALHPLGRLIEPVEVASVIVFVLGTGAAAVTGACFAVDGGLIAKLGV